MRKEAVKIILSLGLLAALSGCDAAVNLNAEAETQIDAVLEQTISSANHHSLYYSYYLEPCVGRLTSERTGDVFDYEGDQFLMNLNISAIIDERYYTEQTGSTDIDGLTVLYERQGQYSDRLAKAHDYTVRIYTASGSELLVSLNTDEMQFYGFCPKAKAAEMLAEMLKIARSVEVDTDTVLADYSNRTTISNTRKQVELFQYYAPESGVIEELFSSNYIISQEDGSTSSDTENYATDNYGLPATEDPAVTETATPEAASETDSTADPAS